MAKMRIEGSFVAMVTPFQADGAIDFGAFRTLIDWQASQGTVALLFMGSTGEPSLLAPEEKKRVVVETVKMKPAGLRFFYGCTGATTDQVIDNVNFAQANGADGAIIAAPPYLCASEEDVERFYLDVADATTLPLGIYNNPPRVKTDLHWEHLLRIFRHPNYVIHKESTTRVGQVAQILAARPDVTVMCCDSPNLGLVVPTMSLGGHGTANMGGNIMPAEMATISTPWKSWREAEAFREPLQAGGFEIREERVDEGWWAVSASRQQAIGSVLGRPSVAWGLCLGRRQRSISRFAAMAARSIR